MSALGVRGLHDRDPFLISQVPKVNGLVDKLQLESHEFASSRDSSKDYFAAASQNLTQRATVRSRTIGSDPIVLLGTGLQSPGNAAQEAETHDF